MISLESLMEADFDLDDTTLAERRIYGTITREEIPSLLTPQQTEVALLLEEGMTYNEIRTKRGVPEIAMWRVRALRLARGWTQEQLAERAGVHEKFLGAVERGERNVTLRNIARIARGLGVPIGVD